MRFINFVVLSFFATALFPIAGALAQPSRVQAAQEAVNSFSAQLDTLLKDQAATKTNLANQQKRHETLIAEDNKKNRSSGETSEAQRLVTVTRNRLIDIEQNIPDLKVQLANARAELAAAKAEANKAAKDAKSAAKSATPVKMAEPKSTAPAKAAEPAKTAAVDPKLAKCNQYADEALTKVTKTIATCGVSGTRWSKERRVHFDGCMGAWGTDANLRSEAAIRASIADNCGARKAACTGYLNTHIKQVNAAHQKKCDFTDPQFGRDSGLIMDWCYGATNVQGGYKAVPDTVLKSEEQARDRRIAACGTPAPARK